MNTSRTMMLLVPLAAMLVVGGCRGNGNTDLLERELRLQEDELYRLEDCLESTQAMLAASRRENEALKRQRDTGDSGAGPSSGGTRGAPSSAAPPSLDLPPGISDPGRTDSAPGGTAPPAIDGPVIEPGVPVAPESDAPPAKAAPRTKSTSLRSEISDEPVSKIVLNRMFTGGLSHGGHGGDGGISVAIEPRSASGQLIKAQGDISIVVLDPAKDGPAARIARWDFSSDEALQHFQQTALARGYYFELPWPSTRPTNPTLHLYTRFTPADGRKLNADMTIEITPPDRQAKRWTKATTSLHDDAPTDSDAKASGEPRGSLAGERKQSSPRRLPPAREALAPPGSNAKKLREATRPKRPSWSPNR